MFRFRFASSVARASSIRDEPMEKCVVAVISAKTDFSRWEVDEASQVFDVPSSMRRVGSEPSSLDVGSPTLRLSVFIGETAFSVAGSAVLVEF